MMQKRLARLLTGVMMLSGAVAGAQGDRVEGGPARRVQGRAAAPAPRPDERPVSRPDGTFELGVRPIEPTSTDRLIDPSDLPSNVVKILRTSNKAQTNSYVPIVFDFKNNNPFNVIRFLRRPVQLEEGELFTFVNPDGNGGKALLVVPDYMAPSLRELVATIDRPELTSSGGDSYSYVQLKHRRADVSDPDFLETAESFSTGNGQTFIVDPEENALFLKDAPSAGESFREALTQWLDVPTAMLDLSVKVYEIDAINDTQLGLDYMAWRNGPGADLFALGAYAEHGSIKRVKNVDVPALPRNNFTASGYNYAFRYDVPSAFFDFLAVKGKARVLNEAKIAALNTRTAELTAGDQVLYYAVRTSDPSGVRNTGEPFQANRGRVVVGTTRNDDLEPVQTGLTLKVTPVIGEQTVKMDLDLTWSDYNFVDDTGFPQINNRELKSTLRGKIGEEIVIGGLERQAIIKSTRKAPILGSIPVVGYAFGGESSPSEKSQLVVVITPAAVMKYNLAKTDAEKDYKVKPEEQQVIDEATGVAPVKEPKASWGFDQVGLDKEYGVEAAPMK